MKKMLKNPGFYIGLVVAFVILYIVIPGGSGGSGDLDGFASCLTEKGVKMYGAEWCGHCKSQKDLFGDSFKLVDYVDCDERSEECLVAGIQGYPTWVINGESRPGETSLEELAMLSGCVLG